MQLCFVSVHGPKKTYFVDEPRTSGPSTVRYKQILKCLTFELFYFHPITRFDRGQAVV
jgi:hypothetical protein